MGLVKSFRVRKTAGIGDRWCVTTNGGINEIPKSKKYRSVASWSDSIFPCRCRCCCCCCFVAVVAATPVQIFAHWKKSSWDQFYNLGLKWVHRNLASAVGIFDFNGHLSLADFTRLFIFSQLDSLRYLPWNPRTSASRFASDQASISLKCMGLISSLIPLLQSKRILCKGTKSCHLQAKLSDFSGNFVLWRIGLI